MLFSQRYELHFRPSRDPGVTLSSFSKGNSFSTLKLGGRGAYFQKSQYILRIECTVLYWIPGPRQAFGEGRPGILGQPKTKYGRPDFWEKLKIIFSDFPFLQFLSS